jgi:hypothetical protein
VLVRFLHAVGDAAPAEAGTVIAISAVTSATSSASVAIGFGPAARLDMDLPSFDVGNGSLPSCGQLYRPYLNR